MARMRLALVAAPSPGTDAAAATSAWPCHPAVGLEVRRVLLTLPPLPLTIVGPGPARGEGSPQAVDILLAAACSGCPTERTSDCPYSAGSLPLVGWAVSPF